MTPTRSRSNYSIQSNRSGPGYSGHKSKRQECQPRGEAQMEDARILTSYQRLSSTFDTLIEIPGAEITAIPFFRPEPFSTDNIRDIPVSVQEMVYGSNTAGVGNSAKSLNRHNELISSTEEVHGPRKDRGPSEGLDPHVLQRKSPKDQSLVEKPKHFVRGPEEEVFPRKGQHPCGSSSSLHKCQKRTRKPQRTIRRAKKRQRERQNPSETVLNLRITELQIKKRQPWTMCSIWQELLWN
ncbi:hypothetical protein O181_020310 [Austropuccinia psidii MF-1]|uniref:Uncharacterized protein n=1 Tax=Austropuccinia psidii MF-1 TaxID=1389203 RepID=A0A9Q3GVZ1_9BASI|nr:hypothetical protein [Austropuccinia psidii MF-1]